MSGRMPQIQVPEHHLVLSFPVQKYIFPQSIIQLYVNDIPIHEWMNSSIHQAATTDAFLNHIKTKFGWQATLYNNIDWEARSNTMKYMPTNIKPWMIKLGTDCLPFLGENLLLVPIFCALCVIYIKKLCLTFYTVLITRVTQINKQHR